MSSVGGVPWEITLRNFAARGGDLGASGGLGPTAAPGMRRANEMPTL